MNKWGYKNGIIYGLLLSCLGALVMYPAVQGASPGESVTFTMSLAHYLSLDWVSLATNSG